MIQKVALLWDIDGTLLTTCGLGRGPLLEAIKLATGLNCDYDPNSVAGFTDHQIIDQLIMELELDATTKEILIDKILETYCQLYQELLPSKDFELLNDVKNTLQKLSMLVHIENWICTGNILKGAKLKLDSVGISEFFSPGDFYCSIRLEERSEIVLRAAKIARSRMMLPIVIGDTAHDIEASRAVGVDCIALESTNYSLEKLINTNPKHLLRTGWTFDELVAAINAS